MIEYQCDKNLCPGTYVQGGKLDKAVRAYTRTILLDPNYLDTHLRRGAVYIEKTIRLP